MRIGIEARKADAAQVERLKSKIQFTVETIENFKKIMFLGKLSKVRWALIHKNIKL